jgi:hypothetical protein
MMSRILRKVGTLVAIAASMFWPVTAAAQSANDSQWAIDVGLGMDNSVNGNVNSGAIGTLQGQTVVILPNPYEDVYGTGLHFRFGLGYLVNDASELRAALTYQSADADLVRLGDFGPSNLYGQYSDYVTFGLDVGYRRYMSFSETRLRAYGEATVGLAFIDEINVLLAAPQSNVVFNDTDFYDRTSSFTWGLNIGALFPIASQLDVTAQIGVRRGSGLSKVDQFANTGLEDINNDSARITIPIVFGLRYRF